MLMLAEQLNNLLRKNMTQPWFDSRWNPLHRVIYSQGCIDWGWPASKPKADLTAVIPAHASSISTVLISNVALTSQASVL